ncbi:RNA polymerase sigma-70 factor, sigma-B/F/G subfamily [Mycolicibacterium chubuense NBB4]|uniref:RNA polymerase sigma-70 factor, sigma-B/F/G subfamily n=1 Tax=Mycolicibacterium chubuense (strain NBB4) TaxID=710421 RepID=I4BIC8_MYCCN|nr:SigB/SigF/SigG family RNA polymerase sigma factor [Mycolicibacterium chubuense]AFM17035.1 RNA polymerase sigma-70 factor, sigma-B/F/G subfamily [Mycolicibacterium chubuense NBB4]
MTTYQLGATLDPRPQRATTHQVTRLETTPSSVDEDGIHDMFHLLAAAAKTSHEYIRLREAIVERCLPLAENIARRYARRGMEMDDLTQVARVGLLAAVDRFDVSRGSTFIGFAVPTIMGEVRRHFRDHAWTVHVPRRIRDRHVAITKATVNLTQTLQRAPTATELSGALGIDRDEVIESLVAADAYSPPSLDRPVEGSDGRSTVGDAIGVIDSRLDHITDRVALEPLIAALTERQREVLYLRFFASMTQSQIAERIGVSQMHVSRILAATLRELRAQLE